MSEFLAALEATEAAQFFRTSRLGYAALSAVHILGIALLVGAVMSLNLRLLGVWKTTSLSALTRVLVPVAAAGLMLAIVTGGFLFSVRATEYLGIGFLQAKVVLVALGIVSAVTIHSAYGLTLDGASRERRVFHALISTACWLGALACGRLIAFAVD
jgi:cbb3-type cytochrome oxidase subunit 1